MDKTQFFYNDELKDLYKKLKKKQTIHLEFTY